MATVCCFNLEWHISSQELDQFFSCQQSQRIVSKPYTFNININGINDQITFFLMCYPRGIGHADDNNKNNSNNNNNKRKNVNNNNNNKNNNNNNNINNNINNNNNGEHKMDYDSHIGIHLSDIPLFIHQIRSTVKFKLPQIYKNYGHFDSVIFDLYNNSDYFTPLGFISYNQLKSLINSQKTNRRIIIQCQLQILRMSTINQQSVSFKNHNSNNNKNNNNNNNNHGLNQRISSIELKIEELNQKCSSFDSKIDQIVESMNIIQKLLITASTMNMNMNNNK